VKDLPIGTYEEGLTWVGHQRAVHFAEVPVNAPMVKVFAALVEDGNPGYWDEDFARRRWGGILSPPAMLHVWLMPLQWRPQGAETYRNLGLEVPLPGNTLINAAVDTTFHHPIRVGDHLNLTERIVSVSPEKHSRVGVGHFVASEATYRNQCGIQVARQTNTLFRYSS
jgi:acyl dehydratase